MNNKVLLFILIGLAAIFALSKVLSGDDNSSFNPEFIKVNQEAVTKVILKTKADGQVEAVLAKNDNGWTISKNGKTFQADIDQVNNLLTNLTSVKSNFIAAKSADKWPEYELNADQSSHITVYGGNKILTEFYIGKFSVNQQAQQITSYFRLADKNDVYAVVSMAGMMLGQGSDSYRDKKILDLDISNIESLNYEGDAVYQVTKKNGNWLLDGTTPLDTAKVQNFLMNLRTMSGDSFVEFDENLNSDKLLKELTISGGNLPDPVIVRCWTNEAAEKPFVVQSSQFPDSYFSSDSTRLFTRIFKPVSEW